MKEFDRLVNLIWRVPVGVLLGAMGYAMVKGVAVMLLYSYASNLPAWVVTLVGWGVPAVVPLGCLMWAFWEFISPPKPPSYPSAGPY